MPGVLIWGYEPTTKTWVPIKVDADGVVQVYDPKVGSLISYAGTTTADGAGGGTNLIDSVLATKPDYNGNLVIITSGDYAGQARDINGVTTGGTVTPASAFGGQIVSGVTFAIVGIRTVPAEVAAIQAALTAHETAQATHRTALGTHDTDIKALLATIAGYIDTEVAAIKTQTDKIAGKMLFCMDFWSDPVEEVPVGDAVAGATEALPSVTVADLPAGATIVRAIAMFKSRMIENTNAVANKLNGATVAATSQVIQVDDSGATGYVDAINFVDDQFGIAATTREGGDVLIGSIDIATRVDGNDTYSVRWLLARADFDYLNFNDVQVGLRIWYSV